MEAKGGIGWALFWHENMYVSVLSHGSEYVPFPHGELVLNLSQISIVSYSGDGHIPSPMLSQHRSTCLVPVSGLLFNCAVPYVDAACAFLCCITRSAHLLGEFVLHSLAVHSFTVQLVVRTPYCLNRWGKLPPKSLHNTFRQANRSLGCRFL